MSRCNANFGLTVLLVVGMMAALVTKANAQTLTAKFNGVELTNNQVVVIPYEGAIGPFLQKFELNSTYVSAASPSYAIQVMIGRPGWTPIEISAPHTKLATNGLTANLTFNFTWDGRVMYNNTACPYDNGVYPCYSAQGEDYKTASASTGFESDVHNETILTVYCQFTLKLTIKLQRNVSLIPDAWSIRPRVSVNNIADVPPPQPTETVTALSQNRFVNITVDVYPSQVYYDGFKLRFRQPLFFFLYSEPGFYNSGGYGPIAEAIATQQFSFNMQSIKRFTAFGQTIISGRYARLYRTEVAYVFIRGLNLTHVWTPSQLTFSYDTFTRSFRCTTSGAVSFSASDLADAATGNMTYHMIPAFDHFKTAPNNKVQLSVAYTAANFTDNFDFATVRLDISNATFDPSFFNTSRVFPCAEAGKEMFGSDCATCDTSRFDPSTNTTGKVQHQCGICLAGKYGHFCEFTDPILASIYYCSGVGFIGNQDDSNSYVHHTRDCSCNFYHVSSVIVNYGEKCELDADACSKKHCGGSSLCSFWDTDALYSHWIDPYCKCGTLDPNSPTIMESFRTPVSGCAECKQGFDVTQDCKFCAPGVYGYACQHSNNTACVADNGIAGYNNCNGHGECMEGRFNNAQQKCNCTGGYSGPECATAPNAANTCGGAGVGSVVTRQTSTPDTLGRRDAFQVCSCVDNNKFGFKCNDTDCYDALRFKGVNPSQFGHTYAVDKTSSCLNCLPGFTGYVSDTGITAIRCGVCISGLYGPFCNYTDASVCGATICSGHGTCGNNGRFDCTCDVGWGGLNCSISDAADNALRCNNTGTAIVKYNDDGTYKSHKCRCNAGSAGSSCSNTPAQCSASQCNNRGRCKAVYDEPCECDLNAWGSTCQELNGRKVICNDHGDYKVNGTAFDRCTCDSGYVGKNCMMTTAECSAYHCNGHGTCDDTGQSALSFASLHASVQCVCDDGWGGSTCGVWVNAFQRVITNSANNTYDVSVNEQLGVSGNTSIVVGDAVINGSISSLPDVMTAFMDAGVSFVYYNTSELIGQAVRHNPVEMEILRSQTSHSSVYNRIKKLIGSKMTLQDVVDGDVNVMAVCSQGTIVEGYEEYKAMHLTTSDIICIDSGLPGNLTEVMGCEDRAAPGYINASTMLVTDASGNRIPCPVMTIRELYTGVSLTIVSAQNLRRTTLSRLSTGTVSLTDTAQRSCVNVLESFIVTLTDNAKRLYMVSANCTTGATSPLFVDIFNLNGTQYRNHTYLITQYLEALGSSLPFATSDVEWAPVAKRLLVMHPVFGWNLLKLNVTSGLFQGTYVSTIGASGYALSRIAPSIMMDTENYMIIVYNSLSNMAARPIGVNLTSFDLGQSYFQFAHPLSPFSSAPFIPSEFPGIISARQLGFTTRARKHVGLVLLGGHVLLSYEEIFDSSNSTRPTVFASQLCSSPVDVDFTEPSTSFCYDSNVQLDNGGGISSTSVTTMYNNPLLNDTRQILVYRPVDTDGVYPMVLYVVRKRHATVFSVLAHSEESLADDRFKPSSRRIQDIDLSLIVPAIATTECTQGFIDGRSTIMVVVCGTWTLWFNMDTRSHFLSFVTAFNSTKTISSVSYVPTSSTFYLTSVNGTNVDIFSPELSSSFWTPESLCMHGGVMNTTTQGCACSQFYTGQYCEVPVNPCLNGIEAVDDACPCTAFFNGTFCGGEVNPCGLHGVRNATDPDNIHCTCAPGWAGVFCTDSGDNDLLGTLSKTEVIIVGSAIGGAIALVGLYIVAMKQGWIAVPKVFSRFVYSRVSNG